MSTLLYNKKANGKLLLTGEYFVLDGAKAIACPTSYGQTLTVKSSDIFSWKSYDHLDHIWLEITGNRLNTEIEKKLLDILYSIDGFTFKDTYEIRMDFPRDWGLGSSSTLIALLADYFQINPFELNHKMFEGSGYDIACAFSKTPILYSNDNKHAPSIESIQISENIKPYCYFAYLNKKQDSREGIHLYKKIGRNKSAFIQEISSITEELIKKQNLQDWIYLLGKHEEIISSSLSLPRAADTVLKGLPFFSKSLGAWGGDFVMILSDKSQEDIASQLKLININTIIYFDA
ncbi:MAG: GYDIA family GHMP kinase [Chitinophagales bacterium]